MQQDDALTKKPVEGFKLSDIPLEDKQKLVGAFAWLIQEDKKQNPTAYQRNNSHD
ncbi:MAG: hypothetical protein KBB70_00975 [Candidatus Pacebacteria bacterium]|nr:hypothetical protein [Candidatus Paceibacterota bacterium]